MDILHLEAELVFSRADKPIQDQPYLVTGVGHGKEVAKLVDHHLFAAGNLPDHVELDDIDIPHGRRSETVNVHVDGEPDLNQAPSSRAFSVGNRKLERFGILIEQC